MNNLGKSKSIEKLIDHFYNYIRIMSTIIKKKIFFIGEQTKSIFLFEN